MRIWLIRAGQFALTVGITWLIVDAVGFELAELQSLNSEIRELDLNPVIAKADGATVIDARILL